MLKANGLEYEVKGTGEPVLLIHGAIIAEAYTALMKEAPLASYRLIRYHRRAYAGSARHSGPFTIADQAKDALAVLRGLGVERAHVVGHSYGGSIVLQLALDAPEAVQSLVLLEPALMMVPSGEPFFESLAPTFQAYEAGDKATAVDTFCQAVSGPDYRERSVGVPENWLDQAVADFDGLMTVELPALEEWRFDQELAARIKQPALAVRGAESFQIFVEGHELLRQWLRQAERFVLPNATHSLQMMNPSGVAEGLAAFFARHPMRVAAR